jgi:hypothetical protein
MEQQAAVLDERTRGFAQTVGQAVTTLQRFVNEVDPEERHQIKEEAKEFWQEVLDTADTIAEAGTDVVAGIQQANEHVMTIFMLAFTAWEDAETPDPVATKKPGTREIKHVLPPSKCRSVKELAKHVPVSKIG